MEEKQSEAVNQLLFLPEFIEICDDVESSILRFQELKVEFDDIESHAYWKLSSKRTSFNINFKVRPNKPVEFGNNHAFISRIVSSNTKLVEKILQDFDLIHHLTYVEKVLSTEIPMYSVVTFAISVAERRERVKLHLSRIYSTMSSRQQELEKYEKEKLHDKVSNIVEELFNYLGKVSINEIEDILSIEKAKRILNN